MIVRDPRGQNLCRAACSTISCSTEAFREDSTKVDGLFTDALIRKEAEPRSISVVELIGLFHSLTKSVSACPVDLLYDLALDFHRQNDDRSLSIHTKTSSAVCRDRGIISISGCPCPAGEESHTAQYSSNTSCATKAAHSWEELVHDRDDVAYFSSNPLT